MQALRKTAEDSDDAKVLKEKGWVYGKCADAGFPHEETFYRIDVPGAGENVVYRFSKAPSATDPLSKSIQELKALKKSVEANVKPEAEALALPNGSSLASTLLAFVFAVFVGSGATLAVLRLCHATSSAGGEPLLRSA